MATEIYQNEKFEAMESFEYLVIYNMKLASLFETLFHSGSRVICSESPLAMSSLPGPTMISFFSTLARC